jgi:hypothetical protein
LFLRAAGIFFRQFFFVQTAGRGFGDKISYIFFLIYTQKPYFKVMRCIAWVIFVANESRFSF